MKNLFLFACLNIVLVLFVSCSKEVNDLPAATQTGANTFGSRVDGAFWVPAGFGIVPTAPILEARFIDNNLIINARNFSQSPIETEMEIYITNVTAPGIFHLNQATSRYPHQSASYGYFERRKLTPVDEWLTNPEHQGMVEITRLDKTARIVSGTFSFTAESFYTPGQLLKVTEGRFDISY